jgi:hypothetical protein
MPFSTLGLNPYLADLIMQGAIKRKLGESLVAPTLWRQDVTPDPWQQQIGQRVFISRPGKLPLHLRPLQPRRDPTPSAFAMEAFTAELQPWGDMVEMYLPNDIVGVQKESLIKTERLGIQAAETVDRLARYKVMQAYLGGWTCATVAALAGTSAVHVASCNGFAEVNSATNGQPVPVSTTNPLAVTFAAAGVLANTVIAVTPDDPNEPAGPGWLQLGAAIAGGNVTARSAVLAANRPAMVFSGGGNNVDAILGGNTFNLATLTAAVSQLESYPPIPKFPDGLYHAQVGPQAEAQLLLDPAFKAMFHAVELADEYASKTIGRVMGVRLLKNSLAPDSLNCGSLADPTVTGLQSSGAGSSMVSSEIGGEVINNTGQRIGTVLVYGAGHIYETYVAPGEIQPRTEIAERVASQPAQSGGVTLDTSRIEFFYLPPIDAMQQITRGSWKFIGDFPVPTDFTTDAVRRYRRAVACRHAMA